VGNANRVEFLVGLVRQREPVLGCEGDSSLHGAMSLSFSIAATGSNSISLLCGCFMMSCMEFCNEREETV
jgi:hypothetical protein